MGGGNFLKVAGAAALVLSMAYACTQPNALVGREVEKTKAAQPLNALTKAGNEQTPPQAATDAVWPPIGIISVTACIVKCQSNIPAPDFLPDPKDPNVQTGTTLSNPGMIRCFLVTITQDQTWVFGMVGSHTSFPRVSFHDAAPISYPTGTTNAATLYNYTNPVRPNSIDLPKPINGVSTFYVKAFVPNTLTLYLTLEYYDRNTPTLPYAFRPYWGQTANPYVFKFKVEPC